MKESMLWKHLKPRLEKVGKFQKVSDRFTPGIPDVLGVWKGRGIAIELKELTGVRVIKTKFRPRQLDWLRDWSEAGGISLVVSSLGREVYVHDWSFGSTLESGTTTTELERNAKTVFLRVSCVKSWNDLVTQLEILWSRNLSKTLILPFE